MTQFDMILEELTFQMIGAENKSSDLDEKMSNSDEYAMVYKNSMPKKDYSHMMKNRASAKRSESPATSLIQCPDCGCKIKWSYHGSC